MTVSDGTREKIARLRYVNSQHPLTLYILYTNFIDSIGLKIKYRSRSDIERLQVMVTEERERYQESIR